MKAGSLDFARPFGGVSSAVLCAKGLSLRYMECGSDEREMRKALWIITQEFTSFRMNLSDNPWESCRTMLLTLKDNHRDTSENTETAPPKTEIKTSPKTREVG